MKQDIYHVPSTKQYYPIGFKYPISNPLDLRGFRYAQAGNALNTDLGAKHSTPQVVVFANLAANAVAGSKLVAITVAATDGALNNGAIAADELVGGNIAIFTHIPHTIQAMIVANTVVAAGGGVMVVTMDKPLPVNVTAVAMQAECMANPYRNVQTNVTILPIVGVPTMPATTGQFVWLQTWGPRWVAAQLNVGTGVNDDQVVFRNDGSIGQHNPADPTEAMGQHAGFVLSRTFAGAQGAPFIFLQITP